MCLGTGIHIIITNFIILCFKMDGGPQAKSVLLEKCAKMFTTNINDGWVKATNIPNISLNV